MEYRVDPLANISVDLVHVLIDAISVLLDLLEFLLRSLSGLSILDDLSIFVLTVAIVERVVHKRNTAGSTACLALGHLRVLIGVSIVRVALNLSILSHLILSSIILGLSPIVLSLLVLVVHLVLLILIVGVGIGTILLLILTILTSCSILLVLIVHNWLRSGSIVILKSTLIVLVPLSSGLILVR